MAVVVHGSFVFSSRSRTKEINRHSYSTDAADDDSFAVAVIFRWGGCFDLRIGSADTADR